MVVLLGRAPKLLNVDAMNISRQSCRAWGVYILLDIYANALRCVANVELNVDDME